MRITKQLKKFVASINKELEAYEREQSSCFREMNRGIVTGIKDTIYLLGESYGKHQKYRWAYGFELFCKEIGINWELLRRL